jgi:hypothetical protein
MTAASLPAQLWEEIGGVLKPVERLGVERERRFRIPWLGSPSKISPLVVDRRGTVRVGASVADYPYQGTIDLPSNFPTLAEVVPGWYYSIGTDVTDNDPTKTNTGLSFVVGDEIYWDGLSWQDYGNLSFATINQIECTYEKLRELASNGELQPGMQYRLTDYKTRYIQPVTGIEKEAASVEVLLLTAISTNSFSKIVSSEAYANDYIEYDFWDTKLRAVTTPQLDARNGNITFRRDENGNEGGFDIRKVLISVIPYTGGETPVELPFISTVGANNVKIAPYYAKYGSGVTRTKLMVPGVVAHDFEAGTTNYSAGVQFGTKCTNMVFNRANNVTVGNDCSNIVAASVYNTHIGNSCSSLTMSNVTNCKIGDNVQNLSVYFPLVSVEIKNNVNLDSKLLDDYASVLSSTEVLDKVVFAIGADVFLEYYTFDNNLETIEKVIELIPTQKP